MRGTLSHSSARLCEVTGHRSHRDPGADGRSAQPDPGPRAGTATWPALARLASLALLALSIGCNRVDVADRSADADGTAATGPGAEASGATPEFDWPLDPSHPVLSIEVESPSVRGFIHIELMPELAPVTVNEIIDRATEGFYDGTTFHRVIRGFMIQGGDPNSRDRDPNNDGLGRSDVRLLDEFGDAPFLRGVVGIGNKGREHTNGTQLFIMHEDDRNLDGRYTAIGRVIDGMSVVDAIASVATDKVGRWGPKDRPIENVVMKTVEVTGQVVAHRAAAGAKTEATDTTGPDDSTDADAQPPSKL